MSQGSSPALTTEAQPDRSDVVLKARLIMGMSRAGTNWVSKCLNEHSEAVVFGETLYWGRFFVEPDADGLYQESQLEKVFDLLKQHSWSATEGSGPGSLKNLDLAGILRMLDELKEETVAPISPEDLFINLGNAFARCENKTIAIEKTPHHINWIDRIFLNMPNTRAVVHIRDPYTFVLSYKHWADRRSKIERKRFRQRYHSLGCALIWRGYARSIKAALERYPENCMELRFDDFRSEPAEVMKKIQEFFLLHVEPLETRVPATTNTSFPSGERPELSSADIFWINLIAKKEIRLMEYSLRPTSLACLPGVLYSMVRLPLWGTRNYLRMRSGTAGSTLGYMRRWLGV